MKHRPLPRLLVLVPLLAGLGGLSEAQLLATLPAEAPTSIFSARGAKGGGDLLALGSWDLSLLASTELFLPKGGGLNLGQTQPLLFKQTPDLLLSFLFDRRWFVEARVSPDSSVSRYAAGYLGQEGETLKEVRIGTSGIGLPSMPFVSLGTGGSNSFGGLLKAGSGPFEAAALVRYDQAERVRRLFSGSAEISETIIPIMSYIRGRWFLLGSSGPAGNLALYVESLAGDILAGDGTRWRQLGTDEYSLIGSGSSIELVKPAETRIAASWAGYGGTDLLLEGRPAALLFNPAAMPSAWEVLSKYPLAGLPSEIFLRNRASGRRDDGFDAVHANGILEVMRAGAHSPDPRPFETLVPDLYSKVPGATEPDFAPLDYLEIVVTTLSGESVISIDKDAIAGSIEVLRDGVADTAFEVDADQGRLVLLRPPELSEAIELSYLRQSAERRSASLTAGIVGTYRNADDVLAWTALTGHLGIPGKGYAEEGRSDPARLAFVAGSSRSSGKLTWKAAGVAALSLSEASGRYRIEGMEGADGYKSSFYPFAAVIPPGFTFIEEKLPDFDLSWPRLSSALHPDGVASMGLRLDSVTGGTLEIEKIIASPPFPGFGQLVVFIRSSANPAAIGTIEVSVDSGMGSPKAIALEIPLSDASGGWSRFSYDYGTTGAISLQVTEDGAAVPLPGDRGAYDSTRTGASRLVIEAKNLGPGDFVEIDEILLEKARSSQSLEFTGSAAYKDSELHFDLGGMRLLKGLDVALDASSGIASVSFLSGGTSLATGIGPFAVKAGIHGLWDDGGYRFRGRHDITASLPGIPLSLSDRFSLDGTSASFARADSARLDGGALGSLALEASTDYSGGAIAVGRAGFMQAWKANLLLASLLSAEAEARQLSAATVDGLNYDYIAAWRTGFAYLLPAGEEGARSRSLSVKAGLGKEWLSASLKLDARLLGDPDRADLVSLRISPPLPSLGGVAIKTWYSRNWADRRPGTDAGLLEFGISGFRGLRLLDLLWTLPPFAEFGDDASRSVFERAYAASAYSEAVYAPELGLSLSREFGSNVYDLVIPSALSLTYRRELSTKGVDFRDKTLFAGKMDFAALELFARLGRLPVFMDYASDEYRLSCSGAFELPAGGTVSTWNIANQAVVSLFGEQAKPGNRIVVDNHGSLAVTPAGVSWSESVGMDFSWQRGRSLLLDAFDFFASRAARPLGEGIGGLASDYLRSVSLLRPQARSAIGLDAEIKGLRQDQAAPLPDLAFSESWETRISVPQRLSSWAKLALRQTRKGSTGDIALGFQASLGLTLSF